jgi:hypothetical protein
MAAIAFMRYHSFEDPRGRAGAGPHLFHTSSIRHAARSVNASGGERLEGVAAGDALMSRLDRAARRHGDYERSSVETMICARMIFAIIEAG